MRFGDDRRQMVVAFVPKEPTPGPWVYFLFGGGWTSGGVRSWSFAGNWFALHGIPVVLGGYRLAPAHRFPAQLDDVLEGFAFAQRHAEQLGVQGRQAVLSGASAGGHLAALAALRLARDHPGSAGEDAAVRPAGLLLVNAAVDLMVSPTRRGDAAVEALTGHARPWPEADPLTWIVSGPPARADLPRTMLVQGETDELVAPAGAEHFAEALDVVAPGRAVVVHAHWQKHTDLTRLFLDEDPPLTARVTDWLRTFGTQETPGG
jgi:acetyl esterase/lipase